VRVAVPRQEIDPFTVEIVKDSLIAIGDEMFAALQRTSKSTIIYEVLDFASGLTDARGQLITQGNGVTGFLGTLTFAVRSALEKFGPEGLRPGDVLITNDPYGGGGTHLSDVTLIVPIFYDGELVAFSASKAHWTEVGGKDPASPAALLFPGNDEAGQLRRGFSDTNTREACGTISIKDGQLDVE
jgi:N-methylhydantoinase B